MNLFFSCIQRLADRGLTALVATAELYLLRAAPKAMPTGSVPSAIASVHLRQKVARGDGSRFGNFAKQKLALILFGTSFLTLIPVWSSALVITNTASVSSSFGTATDSAFVTTTTTTPSTVEFLRYIPGAPTIQVPQARYSTDGSGTPATLVTTNPITDLSDVPLVLPGPVDLQPAVSYLPGEPIFIRLTDLDQNNDPLVAETILLVVTTLNGGDSILLELTEDAPNSGVFIGAVQSTSLATPVNDRILSVTGSDTISVAYVDVLDPLDTSNQSINIMPASTGLFIAKQAMKDRVSVGDYLQYSLAISNTTPAILNPTVITDILPGGFRYLTGTTTLDGLPVPDPTISTDGRTLSFNIGSIAIGATLDLRYITSVSSAVRTGLAVNTASGTAGGGIVSNTAQAQVRIESALMDKKSHVVGRVIYGDCEPGPADHGSLSLRLQSTANRDQVEYQATLTAEKVAVSEVNVIVSLPEVLEYIPGSVSSGDVRVREPVINDDRLRFAVEDLDADSVTVITFKTKARLNVYGEFTTRAYTEFKTASSLETIGNIPLRTPVATNQVKDYSRVIRPRFDTLSAVLKEADRKELDEMASNLQGQDIRRIHIIGHADIRPIRGRSRSIFADNDQLSNARAKSVSRYLQNKLNLRDDQLEINGMGTNKQVYYSEWLAGTRLNKKEQWQRNRRVEVLVELAKQSLQTRFLIPKTDSGEKSTRTEGLPGELSSAGLGLDAKGITGIRLFMEDGRYVDTDEKGLYHFEGLNPSSHVIQVDQDSLPDHLEAYQCEDNTRFASSPYSRFVDLHSGSLWRADFYLRHKEPISESGAVGIQLTSKLEGSNIHFTASLQGKDIALQSRSLALILPDELRYLSGSAELNGQTRTDPVPSDDQLVFDLEPVASGSWSAILQFKTELTDFYEGEYASMATLNVTTIDGNTHSTRVVENTVLSQAMTNQRLVFKALYNKTDTQLSDQDDQQLQGMIDYLRGKNIRRIDVIAHTDNTTPGPGQLDNYELSQTRAEYVGRILVETLGLHTQQLSISGKGADQPVSDNSTAAGRQFNRRLEIFVTMSDEKIPKMIRIAGGDSGLTTNNIVARMPYPVKATANKKADLPNTTLPEGIITITEGQRLAERIRAIRISLDSRLQPELEVDGAVVPKQRIGFSKKLKSGLTLYSYIGVDLGEPGSHILSLKGIGPFGNARYEQSLSYVRTGEIAGIRVVDTSGNIGDGKTPVVARIQLLDERGEPIKARAELVLKEGDLLPYREDDLLMPELRETPRTITVAADGTIQFAPVSSSGSHSATLAYGDLTVDLQIYIGPAYREWIMVGLAEGTVGYNKLAGNLQNLTAADLEDGYYDDGRLAFYSKGKVLGKYLLTAAFDSDKERDDSENGLFGTIDPDKYYTLYGDTATVRYDATSKEKLYFKLESDRFYAMFGDYRTGLTVTELSRYSRSLTGVKTEYQGRLVEVTAFAAATNHGFVRDEIPGDGTSGLYHLSRADILLNSEKISIETRDRFHSETVLEARQLARYIDYTFDPAAGTIYFREPVYSRDASFNPIYIVAEYESVSAGSREITGGGRVSVKASANGPELGMTMISEGTQGAEADLQGIDLKYEINSNTTLKAEAAQTTNSSSGSELTGNAYLVEIAHRSRIFDGKAYYREQEDDFGLGQQKVSETGTRKIGAETRYRISDQLTANAEVFHLKTISTSASREMISLGLEHKKEKTTYTGGLRHAVDEDSAGLTHKSTLLTGSARRSFLADRLDLYSSAELAIGDDANSDYPSRLQFGGEYALTAAASIFAVQELTYGENQDGQATRIGIKGTPWQGGSFRSSIADQRGEYGARTFANMGLTQGMKLSETVHLDFGLERTETIRHPGDTPLNTNVPPASGAISDDFTAASAGLTWKEKRWSATGRAEYRDGEQEDKTTLLFGFYREQSPGFGLSTNIKHFNTDRTTGTGSTSSELEFSVAWRPVGSQLIILEKAQLKDDEEETPGNTSRTRKYINNLNANYLFDRRNQLAFAHGIKSVTDSFNSLELNSVSQFVGIEYRHDINPQWDLGLQASTMFTDAGSNSVYSYGISAGHSFAKNIWLSLGFNFTGFTDEDFTAAEYTTDGAYLKFRLKFDQHTVREMLAWWEK